MWDVFVSYASEDKETAARPIATALKDRGFRVWFDDFELKIGDSLRKRIDDGIATCNYGVVVLSPQFFSKDWTQKELDGFVARESAGEILILPVLHRMEPHEVTEYSPMLAGRLAADTSKGIETVINQLLTALGPPSSWTREDQQSESSHAFPESTFRAVDARTYDFSSTPVLFAAEFQRKLRGQEQVLWSILRGDSVNSALRERINAQFFPWIDPLVIQILREEVFKGGPYAKIVEGFSIDPSMVDPNPPDFEAIKALSNRKNLPEVAAYAEGYCGTRLVQHGVAMAAAHEIDRLIENNVHPLVFVGAFLHLLIADQENVEFGVPKDSMFAFLRNGLVRSTVNLTANETRLVYEMNRAGINVNRFGLAEESELVSRSIILLGYQNRLAEAQLDWLKWLAETVPPITDL